MDTDGKRNENLPGFSSSRTRIGFHRPKFSFVCLNPCLSVVELNACALFSSRRGAANDMRGRVCSPGIESSEYARSEKGFDGGGEGRGKIGKHGRIIGFGKRERTGGGLQEAAGGLLRVTDEPLSQGQRIDGEGQPIDQSVPAVGFAAFDGAKVSLDDALVAQRAQALQLALAGKAAGGGEILEHGFTGHLTVASDEFADFIAAGVVKRALDGRKFERLQNPGVVILEEQLQIRRSGNPADGKIAGTAGERGQTGRRAELLDQWPKVTE